MKILIGDISSYKAMVVAKFLKTNYPDILIYSFDSKDFTNKYHTKYTDKHFVLSSYKIVSFLDLIQKYKIEFFLPVINEELKVFWKNKEIFKQTLDYLGDFEDFSILNDKVLLHDLAEKLKVKVPKKYKIIEEAIPPYVIKPTNLSSAEGVIYINNKNEVPKDYNFDDTIIQEFVKGVGVGYSFYSKNGIILNGYGHKRLAEFPISGGSSTYRTGYQDNRMVVIANKIVKHLSYTGFAMFEFKLTDDNELYLLEVNPRIWGSINQGLENGVNYFEGILGPSKLKQTNQVREINTFISPHIYLTLIQYLFKFSFKQINFFVKNIFSNKPDVSLLNDSRGYMSSILRKLSK